MHTGELLPVNKAAQPSLVCGDAHVSGLARVHPKFVSLCVGRHQGCGAGRGPSPGL